MKDIFGRKLVAIKDVMTNNCLFEAVLYEMSNSEYVIDDEGKFYQPNDLRMQGMYFSAKNFINQMISECKECILVPKTMKKCTKQFNII